MRNLEKRLALHKAFWDGAVMDEPIVSFRIGDYFFADKFKANLPLLVKGHVLTPEQVMVDDYLEDYERMYLDCERTGQSAFFTADPCTGIPWIEGMVGCSIVGEEVSFMATPTCESIEEIGEIQFDPSHPWMQKYIEFLEKLGKLSADRFPVGQPIMRGTTDVIGTMMGQSELACATMTDPELVHLRFGQVATLLRAVIEEQYRHVKPFLGGYAAGFYHLWAPGSLIWYQEDLSAILSKRHFDEYLRETSERICSGYDYSFVHLHPNSFFHLDGILSLKNLCAVQINKDVSGPTVEEMLPVFRRVLDADKRLIIWGDLTEAEISMIMEVLPHKGLFLNVIAPTVEAAQAINEIAVSKWKT